MNLLTLLSVSKFPCQGMWCPCTQRCEIIYFLFFCMTPFQGVKCLAFMMQQHGLGVLRNLRWTWRNSTIPRMASRFHQAVWRLESPNPGFKYSILWAGEQMISSSSSFCPIFAKVFKPWFVFWSTNGFPFSIGILLLIPGSPDSTNLRIKILEIGGASTGINALTIFGFV